MNKTAKILKVILEVIWLIMAIFSLGIGIKESITLGIMQNWIYFLFSLIAFFFYFNRRNQRLKT